MEKIKDLKSSKPIIVPIALILSLIIFLFASALPIAMIVIGATNINKCTIEPMIPIWLIVSGSTAIFLALVSSLIAISQIIIEKVFLVAISSSCTGLFGVFQFAWFIAGNVWVYSRHGTVNFVDSSSSLYCDKTLYLFSFWTITSTYILIGSMFIICIFTACTILIISCCCCKK